MQSVSLAPRRLGSVPDPLRRLMLSHPRELYPLFFQSASAALRDLCGNPKYLGGDPGFIAVLHTWTRRMLHHPHLHFLVPAVGLAAQGCALRHPPNEDYLIPERALAARVRALFAARLRERHPELAGRVDLRPCSPCWIVQCQSAGRGQSALRYLAAYVKKSAFSEERLLGCDPAGRILLRDKDSSDNQWKVEPLDPLELIRRWLLHVLPHGLVRVRHYGWLSPAAHKAYRRVRFLLGLGPARCPDPVASSPPACPRCQSPLTRIGSIPPVRGPPRSRTLLTRAA